MLSEGRHLDGYAIYVQNGIIIGIFPVYCYIVE